MAKPIKISSNKLRLNLIYLIFAAILLAFFFYQYRLPSATPSLFQFQNLLFLGLAFGLIGLALWTNWVINRREAELFAIYPELNNSLQNLQNADYIDERLRVLVYKDHLISFASTLHMIDLREITSIQTYIINQYHNGVKHTSFYIQTKNSNGKKINLPVKRYKKETDFRLQALYDYIESR